MYSFIINQFNSDKNARWTSIATEMKEVLLTPSHEHSVVLPYTLYKLTVTSLLF